MEQLTKEKDNTIKEKLDYLGLDLEHVPEFFLEEFRPLEFRPSKLYSEEVHRVYRFVDITKIQIMITTANKADLLRDRYAQADPIYRYMVPQTEEDIVKHSMFLKMIQQIHMDQIEEIEREQKRLLDVTPFEVKYPKNYLWQVYYDEGSNQYFMLVSVEEQDTSCFFYLLKEQIKAKKTGENKTIYLPITNMEYSLDYLKRSEMQDIEKYLWLFTQNWPITYEVWNQEKQGSIQIVGTTFVYEKIKSNYKITLETKEETVKFYKLLKALFILQTELPHEYEFECMISEKGSLEFLYDNKVITYEGLSKFIKKQYELKKDNIKEIQRELTQVKETLQELQKTEKEKEEEYKRKERQIATFLEYRRTFFGRIKYFFKKGKFSKKETNEEVVRAEERKEEKKITFEEKDYYTIEDLLEICKTFERLHTDLKNEILDKKALEYKVQEISKKLDNATQYIEEINEHKKSLFEFWKFANKDKVLGLEEGAIQEEKANEKKMKKIFDYEEDFEELGIQFDRYQKQELTKEECDSIYLTTTDVINDMNRLKNKEQESFGESLTVIKQKAQEKMLSEEEFDIFGAVSEDHTKIKTLGNKKHREIHKDEIKLLDITKNTTEKEYIENLSKQLENLQKTMGHVKSVADISVYLVQDTVLNTEEFGIFHINPDHALAEEKELDKVNLYRINIKQGMPMVALSNIIFYDNKNKTLPDGMDVSDGVLVDMSQYKFELKRQKLFRVNQELDEIQVKNKIICVYEYDVTI